MFGPSFRSVPSFFPSAGRDRGAAAEDGIGAMAAALVEKLALRELRVTSPAAGVLLCELLRPERLNALSEAMGEDLRALFRRIREEPGPARCLVLAGSECAKLDRRRAFSTGRDLKISAAHRTQAEKDRYMALALESVLELKALPIPTIAAISGPAFGWGAELALAADIRIAEDDATLCFPETSLGLFPGAAGAVLLPRLIPPHLAKEMIFTAARYTGAQARDMRLVNSTAPDAVASALAMAERVASNAPLGLRGAKAVMEAATAGDLEAALAASRRLRPPLTDTEDFREGLRAFAERRPPAFRGR